MSGLKAAPRAFVTHRPPLMAQRPKTVVGLDIDPVGITAAELGSAGRIAPDKTATLTLEPGIVRDGEILDVEALTHALKELYKLNKNLDRRVRVGLANQKIVVRTIEMPIIKDRKELAAAVRFQAADELPMPLDQAVLDWQPLETIETEAGVRQRVLLVAARRDMIDKVVAAVRGAGLRLEGIDLSAFGLIRALSVPGADSENANTEAVLYVAAGGLTNLAVARGMQCMFTRAAGGGVEAIAVDLAERRGLTLEHARGWLTYVGLDADITTLEGDAEIVAEARAALEDGVRRVATDVRQSLDFFHMQSGGTPVSRAVLSGAAVAIPGFAESLAGELHLPVVIGDVPGGPADAPGVYSVAAGLSVPGTPDINLLPPEERRAAGSGGRSGGVVYAVLGALAVAAALLSVNAMVSNDVSSKQQQLGVITQQAGGVENVAGNLAAYTDFSALRQRRTDAIHQLVAGRTNWAHHLGEIARTLPRNVWLNSMGGQNGAAPAVGVAPAAGSGGPLIKISGCTTSHRGVSSMIAAMRSMDGIQKVALTSTEKSGGDAATGGSGGGGGGNGDCRGSHKNFALFSMELTFAAPSVPAPSGATGATGATGSTQPAAGTGQTVPAPAPASAPAPTPTSSGSPQ